MTEFIYHDIAPGAKENSTPSTTDKQDFVNLEELKETITVPKTATFEKNYWSLDGSFSVLPDDLSGLKFGLWSKSVSSSDGSFDAYPVLTVTFSGLYSSVGITFEFNQYGPDWCNDLNIKWYRDSAIIDSADFTPDNWRYSCLREVTNFNKVVITFRSMSKPSRYLKVKSITYGYDRVFSSDELRSLSLYQAVSITSDEIEVNTADFTISSNDHVPFLFQRKQPLDLYHNGVLQGVFYISKSRRIAASIYDIESSCMIGLLDESYHRGGIYENALFSEILADVLTGYEYELDNGLSNVRLSGWLPYDTRRNNLAQLAFAAGAMVDTSGSSKIKVFKPKTSVTSSFDAGRVYLGSEIDTEALVTSVKVTAHTYTKNNEETELFNDVLDGTAEISFSSPAHSLSISGGTIGASGPNFAIITGTGSNVTLTGKGYTETTQIVTIDNPDVSASDIENVVEVSDATLVSLSNVNDVAQRVYDRYQRRETVNAEVVFANEMPGDSVTIQTEFDGEKTGTLISVSADLARKKIGEAVILCQ